MERGLIRVNNFPAGLEHGRDNMVILLYNLVLYEFNFTEVEVETEREREMHCI